MPLYNDLTATRPWIPSTTVNASIKLDQPGKVTFTNLDFISGKVVVKCAKPLDLENVVVKLEGESRTRLQSPAEVDGKRPKPQLEYHKVRHYSGAYSIRYSRLLTVDRHCTKFKLYFLPRKLYKADLITAAEKT